MHNPYKPLCYQDFLLSQQDCGGQIPKSGLFIEQLSGISKEMLAYSANGNNITAKDNLQDRTFSALLKLENMVKQRLADLGLAFRAQGQVQKYCSFDKSSTGHPPIGSDKVGLIIKKISPRARYNSLQVERLNIKSFTTGLHTIQLLDTNGNILQSLSVNLTAGQATSVAVNWNLFLDCQGSYRIVWANSNATPAKGACDCNSVNCCGTNINYSQPDNIWYQIKGWNGSQCDSSSYGIQLTATVKCDIQNLMCGLLDELKMAVLYLTGAELADAASSPQRTTAASVNGSEWLLMKKQEWEAAAQKIVEQVVNSNVERLKQEDSFCLYSKKLFAPVVAPFAPISQPVKQVQATILQAQESYQQAVLQPSKEYYHELAEAYQNIQYELIYGNRLMYFGFHLRTF